MLTAPCACPEGRLDDGRPVPPVHDCDYIAKRNALIPHASRVATDRVRETHPDVEEPRTVPAWSTYFMREMDRLASEAMREGRL